MTWLNQVFGYDALNRLTAANDTNYTRSADNGDPQARDNDHQ
jgi:hypothetical protein